MKSRAEIFSEWYEKMEKQWCKLPYEAVTALITTDHILKEFNEYYKSYKEDKPVTLLRPSPHKIRRKER